jgi:hypothetical protein
MKRKIIFVSCAFGCLLILSLTTVIKHEASEPSKKVIRSKRNQVSKALEPFSREEKLKNLIATNDKIIEFYGEVLDTSGVPLQNVEVSWDLLKSGSFQPSLGFSTGSRGITKTDSTGCFSILNERGVTLSIDSLKYPGYHNIDSAVRSFGYHNAEPHQPNASAPIRFVMTKDGGTRSHKVNIPLNFDWDRLPKEFKIGFEEISEKIILIPSREPQKSGERGYDWKVVIRVDNGKLILGKAGDAPIAPDSGYIKEIIISEYAGGNWMSNSNCLIYVKTDSGKYAELNLNVYSDRDMNDSITGRIYVRWNPDGGRAFE